MATLSWQLFGGKKPDRTRYYACELKWNTWNCKRTHEKNWTPESDTLVTQLVPVNDAYPQWADKAIIFYNLQKPVRVISGKKE